MNPHVQDYADRIWEAARKDRYPVKPSRVDAQMLASAYGVELTEPPPATLREVCAAIATKLVR